MRHVIVEGCDGSGKSTMVELLLNKRGGERAPKASTSLGGPIDNLAMWVMQQEEEIQLRSADQPRLVYDRHPMISELIYGPIVRGRLASWEFDDSGWVATRNLFIKQHFLVIWCLAPVQRMIANTSDERDAPGVTANIIPLANAYQQRARLWNGLSIVFDPFAGIEPDEFLAHYDMKLGV